VQAASCKLQAAGWALQAESRTKGGVLSGGFSDSGIALSLGFRLALDGKTLSTARPSRRQDPLDGKKKTRRRDTREKAKGKARVSRQTREKAKGKARVSRQTREKA
jgi:hypothetical protein